MVIIDKWTDEANSVEVIRDKLGKLWLNERHVQEQLGLESTKQPNRRFIHIDLALKIIMDCITDKSCKFKRNLGFTLCDVLILKNKQ